MEWWLLLITFLSSLIVLLALGLPVAFAFMLVNLMIVIVVMGPMTGPFQMLMNMFSSITTFTLAPIPLFILMGEMLFHSGLALRALDVMSKMLGRFPGRLSVLANMGGTVFAALSGSPMANTAMLGSLLAPEMERRGYSRLMSIGPIMASGGVAMIIPPSTLSVLYGTIAQISIAQLLIAGIIPGLLMAANYLVYIVISCILKPELAPAYDVEAVAYKEKIISFLKDVLPLGFLIFLVIGLIFLGIATPTESAAMGALGAFILPLFYRSFSWDVVQKALKATVKISGMTLLIVAGSMIFSQIMAFTGATAGLVTLMVGLSLPPILKLIAMQLVILVLGVFIDQVSIMMITIPLFMPIVVALGFDPIWFGILMLINLEIALTTPPFGMLLFVMKGVAPKGVSMKDIYRCVLPFVLCDTVAMLLIMIFPSLATWLPGLISR